MLEAVDSSISLTSLIWLFIAVFMVHDLEEIIFVENWMKKNRDTMEHKIPRWFQTRMKSITSITSSQFAVAVSFELIFFIPFTYLAAERQSYLLFMGFNALMFAHVFTHIGQSIFMRRYTPGVVTAVLLSLPYSSYLFYRLLDADIASWPEIWLSLIVGLVTVGPLVLLGHVSAKYIVPKR